MVDDFTCSVINITSAAFRGETGECGVALGASCTMTVTFAIVSAFSAFVEATGVVNGEVEDTSSGITAVEATVPVNEVVDNDVDLVVSASVVNMMVFAADADLEYESVCIVVVACGPAASMVDDLPFSVADAPFA
jgi:hypothetical protein